MFLKALFSAILITGVCYSAGAKASDDGWLLVPNSDRNILKSYAVKEKNSSGGFFQGTVHQIIRLPEIFISVIHLMAELF